MSSIIYRSSDEANEEEQERLQASDPGNMGRGGLEGLTGLIVGLLFSKGIQESPSSWCQRSLG
jgi:hypothetical protein